MYKFFPLFSLNLRVYVFLPNLCFCFTSILTMMHLCIMLYMYWTTLVFKQIRERPQPKSECAKSEESHSKIWDPQKGSLMSIPKLCHGFYSGSASHKSERRRRKMLMVLVIIITQCH